ncbi:unnamed protein product, partial [Didymodactylos carnosus]
MVDNSILDYINYNKSHDNDDNKLSENDFFAILLDYCLLRFVDQDIHCWHWNTYHVREIFADALKWTNGFTAKLSGSRLTGLVEQYYTFTDEDVPLEVSGDMDIMFEPNNAFVSDLDTESPLQIGFADPSPFIGFYHIRYNERTTCPIEVDVFEQFNGKRHLSSEKVASLIHAEFSKYNQQGPVVAELHGPAVTPTMNSMGTSFSSQDYVLAWLMPQIPYHIRQQWLERPKTMALIPKRQDTMTWRLSLSFPEALLTNSFDIKQKSCLMLLNSFVREIAPGKVHDSIKLKCLQNICEKSHKYFPSTSQWCTNIEELLFTWLNVTLTSSLMKQLPEYFESVVHEQNQLARQSWLGEKVLEPITRVFGVLSDLSQIANDETDDEDEDDNDQ